MNYKFSKLIINYDKSVLKRIELQKYLSQNSPIFPVLTFDITEKSILQKSEIIKKHPWPKDKELLKHFWDEFKIEIEKMHLVGYIHGDILKKNMIFDGCRIRLIDHEISLKQGGNLRVTYPWVSIEDLETENISYKTDHICIKASELRFFDDEKYKKFRDTQQQALDSKFSKSIKMINR
jgi:hypothetical protein